MTSPHTIALREADMLRRLAAGSSAQATCSTCKTPAGAIVIERSKGVQVRLRNSNFVKEGDAYNHADRRICQAILASRTAAQRREGAAGVQGGGQDDVPVVPTGASPTVVVPPSLP